MKSVTITGADYENMVQIHETLAKELDFPDYYGKNLDALYDVLTESDEEMEIILDFEGASENVARGLGKMANVISDATIENEGLSLILIEV